MVMLSREALKQMGFAAVGENVLISERASFYNPSRISLGSNVRIDDFCVLSAGMGGIVIGQHVHIAVFSSLIGAGKITLGGFSNISSRVSIYSSNDDYSGSAMTNPTISDAYKHVHAADVVVGRHVIIGSGCVVLPGVTLGEGVAVGALSLVKDDCAPFGIYAGIPAEWRRKRSRALLEVEARFLSDQEAVRLSSPSPPLRKC